MSTCLLLLFLPSCANRCVDDDRILQELNTVDDPAWVYFDSQHKHIIEKLNEVYEKGCRNIEGENLPFLLHFSLTLTHHTQM